MITMKNRFKIIIPAVLIILLFIAIIVILIGRNNDLSIISYKKHYSILSEDYPKIEIMVYANKNDSEYFSIEKIDKCSLFNDDDFYNTYIDNISLLDNSKSINNEMYFQYKLELKMNFLIENSFSIKNAKLEVIYKSGERLLLNIGNICFEKITYNSLLDVDKVQSICNDLGNLESLVAVKISLNNNTENDVVIKSIKPISSTIEVNNDFVQVKDYDYQLDHTVPVTDLFGSNYNVYKKTIYSFNHILLEKNTAKDIIIPLTYIEKEYVDHLGFVIELENSEGITYQIVNPYILFTTSNMSHVLYEYEITKS